MTELEIPHAALNVLHTITDVDARADMSDVDVRVVREIALPVVAAELRRFAAELIRPYDETGAWWPVIKDAHDRMLRRADELDGGEQS
ncbi:hypothetical protein EV383_4467 [Pseudonocardia sediminis]|uniref:Uncharacterized protein n=1 Tax=Pseudonocardia sediminis TaxID=1397368 RepID=A0A4Q7UZH2_PSEST|nr:hypothetical protein [Pseudonocardia sediminis]RZT87542.1 hypothetical protein EV383_4467 [Pseudonocardia sediminis]